MTARLKLCKSCSSRESVEPSEAHPELIEPGFFNNPPITQTLARTPPMPIPLVLPFPLDRIMADSTVKKSSDVPESRRRLLYGFPYLI